MKDVVFLFLLHREAPIRPSSELLLYFLKIMITTAICLVPVIDC